jgi:hypothetical protein
MYVEPVASQIRVPRWQADHRRNARNTRFRPSSSTPPSTRARTPLGSSISIRPPVCASCGGSRCIAFGISVATVTGVNRTVARNSVAASWRRQLWISLRVMWCRRDISDTVLPDADASARIAFFYSAL